MTADERREIIERIMSHDYNQLLDEELEDLDDLVAGYFPYKS